MESSHGLHAARGPWIEQHCFRLSSCFSVVVTLALDVSATAAAVSVIVVVAVFMLFLFVALVCSCCLLLWLNGLFLLCL